MQKTWTIADTVAFMEVIIGNDGGRPTPEQYASLIAQTGCTRSSAEMMAWRVQTVLGYPFGPARGITALDRELAAIYFARDPRLRRKTA